MFIDINFFPPAVYSLNASTSKSLKLIEEDERSQLLLPSIETFMANRFSYLSLAAYQSNCEIGSSTNVPSFSATSAQIQEDTDVFASNVIVTFDGFHNGPHADNDASKDSFGLFATIHQEDGTLSPSPNGVDEGRFQHSCFVLDKYNTIINFDRCNGVVEQIWNITVLHHTPIPHFFNTSGPELFPTVSSITRFGCSAQISNWLVRRIESIRGDRSAEEWRKFIKYLVSGYYHEISKKKAKLRKK